MERSVEFQLPHLPEFPWFTGSAGIGTCCFQRLPRFQRAGPSTSLDECLVMNQNIYYGEVYHKDERKSNLWHQSCIASQDRPMYIDYL